MREVTSTSVISSCWFSLLNLRFRFRTSRGVLDTISSDKVFSDLRQVCCFVRVPRFPTRKQLIYWNLHKLIYHVFKISLYIFPNSLGLRQRIYPSLRQR